MIINELFLDSFRQQLRQMGLQEVGIGVYTYTPGSRIKYKEHCFIDHRQTILITPGAKPTEIVIRLGHPSKRFQKHTLDVLMDFDQSIHEVLCILGEYILRNRRLYRKDPAIKQRITRIKKLGLYSHTRHQRNSVDRPHIHIRLTRN